MANQSLNETIQIAATLAEFDPAFLDGLNRNLEGWIAKNAKGPASLIWMTPFCDKGHSEQLRGLLALLPPEKLKSIAAKFDKHHPTLSQLSRDEIIQHIVQIASGRIEPAPKPTSARANGKAKTTTRKVSRKLQLSEIVKITEAERRQAELERLSDKELKLQLNEMGMDTPSGLKKAEQIRFIQEELQAGWPRPRSVLDTSRY